MSSGMRKRLTTHQRELLALVIKGLTRREIAQALGVREETVADRLKRLRRRLPGTGTDLVVVRLHAYELLNINDDQQLGSVQHGNVPRDTTPNGGKVARRRIRVRRAARG